MARLLVFGEEHVFEPGSRARLADEYRPATVTPRPDPCIDRRRRPGG